MTDEMGSNHNVNKWALEFAVTKLTNDNLIAKIFSVLPTPKADVQLKKSILLRAIKCQLSDCLLSERTLDALEIIVELDRNDGFDVLESMKTAYASVAVDCTVRFLTKTGGEEDYLNAVKRIWRKRIGRLCSHNVDLVSEQLETWRDVIESSVWDDNVRDKLFSRNTRHEALTAAKIYVDEAWEFTGLKKPKFLELASKTFGRQLVEDQQLCVDKTRRQNEGESLKSFPNFQATGNCSDLEVNCGHDEAVEKHINPSGLVSRSPPKDKAQQEAAAMLSQNPGCDTKHTHDIDNQDEPTTLNDAALAGTHLDENLRFMDIGSPKEQVIASSPPCVSQRQSGSAREAASLVPDACAHNDLDCGGHATGLEGVPFISSTPSGKAAPSNNLEVREKGFLRMRRKHVGGPKRVKRARIVDSEDSEPEKSDRSDAPLSQSQVRRVQEELKCSTKELQAAVIDPLPEALCLAETVLSDVSRKSVSGDPPTSKIMYAHRSKTIVQGQRDEVPTSSHIFEAGTSSVKENTMNHKDVQGDKNYHKDAEHNKYSYEVGDGNGNGHLQNENLRHDNGQTRRSLWDRNASAHTYEWDDSVDGSPEGCRRLPTPRTYINSPLKKYENRKFARRRQIKRWSVLEEDTLRNGVQRFGRGNWKMILNAHRDIFEERTEVDLKDKWRRMTS